MGKTQIMTDSASDISYAEEQKYSMASQQRPNAGANATW